MIIIVLIDKKEANSMIFLQIFPWFRRIRLGLSYAAVNVITEYGVIIHFFLLPLYGCLYIKGNNYVLRTN